MSLRVDCYDCSPGVRAHLTMQEYCALDPVRSQPPLSRRDWFTKYQLPIAGGTSCLRAFELRPARSSICSDRVSRHQINTARVHRRPFIIEASVGSRPAFVVSRVTQSSLPQVNCIAHRNWSLVVLENVEETYISDTGQVVCVMSLNLSLRCLPIRGGRNEP